MSHTEVKHDYMQQNGTDGQTLLSSVQQHMDLELHREQTGGQVRSQPASLARGLIDSGLILWQAQKRAGSAFDAKIRQWAIGPLNWRESAKQLYHAWAYMYHPVRTKKTKLPCWEARGHLIILSWFGGLSWDHSRHYRLKVPYLTIVTT